MKRIMIFGAGGHGRELAWIARRQYEGVVVEFVVDQVQFWQASIDDIKVHLYDDIEHDPDSRSIVALGDPKLRKKAAGKMELKFAPASLRDPSVISSDRLICADGSVIMAGCILTTNVRLGFHVHLNIGCRISHDAVIEDFATLAPGVHLAGNVHVKKGAFLGINSTVINGSTDTPLVIGEGSIVAAGACVTRSIPDFTLIAGVPAKIKSHLSVPNS